MATKTKTAATKLPDWLTGEVAESLLVQAVQVARQRARIRRAHSKDRSEKRGGGAKPWRQKGTGRARHGSRRSPIWTGGGVTFGPRSRKEKKLRMNKNLATKSLVSALRAKNADKSLELIKLPAEAPTKTKDLVAALPKEARGLLIVADEAAVVLQAAKNIAGLKAIVASRVAAADVAVAPAVLLDEAALETLEKRIK